MLKRLWFWVKGIRVYNGFIHDPHDPEYKHYKKGENK